MNGSLRRIAVLLAAAVFLAASILPAGAGGRATDAPPAAQVESDYVIVKLADPPVASYEGGIPGYARTKPLPGRKLNLNAPAARAYGRYLGDRRANFRSWLRSNAPRAQVVREYSVVFNGVAVKLNGEARERLAQGPGVRAVVPSFLVRPAMNISPDLISAPALWSALGGPGSAGEGIKVGIIDTGIDITNPFLSDAGYPPAPQTDACANALPQVNLRKPGGANTNNKVIICRVFFSGVAPGAHVRPTDLVVFDHGTHVAGTVAGNFGTSGQVAGTAVTLTGLSGIAPRALLGDYNVFPGFGAGFVAFGGSAFSHDIAAALEAAVEDGMDVVNMSLGGGVQGPHDFLAEATNAVADAGVVAAVAAGNSGPGPLTVESPGSAEKALTAGASTNPHFVGIPVTFDTTEIPAALGEFGTFKPPVTAPLANWNNTAADAPAGASTQACTALSGTPHLGQIVIIDRGVCTFTTKVRNAEAAGAVGVLVVNNVAGDPIAMVHDGTEPKPTIPAAMVGVADRAALRTAGAAHRTATVDGTAPREFVTSNADIIAGFSSRGPTPFTYLIKPDATAPGVNVASSVFERKFAFFQGTSMATPHLAGSAAVLLQLFRPLYGTSPPLPYPDIVKSAIVNTAKRPVRHHATGAALVNPMDRGGGRVDLLAAMNARAFFSPASVSFGLWQGRRPISASRTVTIMNSSTTSARTYSLAVVFATPLPAGVSVTVSPTPVTVGPGGTQTFTVSLSVAQSVPSFTRFGDIVVTETGSGATMRIPWWVSVDRGP